MRKALRRTTQILLGTTAILLALVVFFAAFLAIAESVVDGSARTLPSYEREDLSATLEKEEWSEEDYAFLYRQTGLGKSALDALKSDPSSILRFQDSLFYEGVLIHEMAAPTTPHDVLKDYTAPLAPLENGDVIVSSTCHTFGWRNGHSALVVDAGRKYVLQSVEPGIRSDISSALWFCHAANFIVLRLKNATAEERAEIAEWATDHLQNIDYSILTGFFSSPKDQGDEPQTTNCSHLVWQAFYHFGYDIDADGGIVCSSRDIANSPYFEVVQVYGFDPIELW